MVRPGKLLVGIVVVTLAGASGLAYAGFAAPYVTPSQLPGPPPTAVGISVVLVLFGVVAAGFLDRRAWKQTGAAAGLAAGDGAEFASEPSESGGSSVLGEPTLGGMVEGRPVRAWTCSVGTDDSSKVYTVVEAQLERPVEWTATFETSPPDEAEPDHGVDALEATTVDGVGVRGDVPDAVAESVLCVRVENALSAVEGGVSVGDVRNNAVGGMLDAIPEDADSMGAKVAKGMLGMAHDGDQGPSRTVEHRGRGLVLDAADLRRRIEAVTTVADAVDRAGRSGV